MSGHGNLERWLVASLPLAAMGLGIAAVLAALYRALRKPHGILAWTLAAAFAWVPYFLLRAMGPADLADHVLTPASGTVVTVATARNNSSRTAANLAETILTPAAVVSGNFGLVCRLPVDGELYAQPLFIPDAAHDLVIVATMHNSVYAFDANGCGQVWRSNFGTAWQYPHYPHIEGSPLEYEREIGASNAAADGGFIYVVTADDAGTWTLRKLSLSTGRQVASATIEGEVPGSGDPRTGNNPGAPLNTDSVVNGKVRFDGRRQMQRTALLINQGKVYIGFGSHADIHPYHGWVFAYRTPDLSRAAVFCSTPSAFGGGVWNGSGGLTALENGDLVFSTGNGDYDGVTAFSQSILRLSGSTLALVDWYTPSEWSAMNEHDSDLGSGPAILIPGTARVVTGAKDYRIFSVDTSCMGRLGGTANGCGPALTFATNPSGELSDHAGVYNGTFFDNTGFFPNAAGPIYRFGFNAGRFDPTPAVSPASYEFPGAQMSVSANGVRDPILWATTAAKSTLYRPRSGTLRALNPARLTEYWNSDQRRWDSLGDLSKYAMPTIANGRVYVSTQSGYVAVYGLRKS